MITPFWRKKNAQLKARLDSVVATSVRAQRTAPPKKRRVEIDTTYVDRNSGLDVRSDWSRTDPGVPGDVGQDVSERSDDNRLGLVVGEAAETQVDTACALDPNTTEDNAEQGCAEDDRELSIDELRELALLLEAEAQMEQAARVAAESRLAVANKEIECLGESIKALKSSLHEAETQLNEDAARPTSEALAEAASLRESTKLAERLAEAEADGQRERAACVAAEDRLAHAMCRLEELERTQEAKIAALTKETSRLQDELLERSREADRQAQETGQKLVHALSERSELEARARAAEELATSRLEAVSRLEASIAAETETRLAAEVQRDEIMRELSSAREALAGLDQARLEGYEALSRARDQERELVQKLEETERRAQEADSARASHANEAAAKIAALERDLARLSDEAERRVQEADSARASHANEAAARIATFERDLARLNDLIAERDQLLERASAREREAVELTSGAAAQESSARQEADAMYELTHAPRRMGALGERPVAAECAHLEAEKAPAARVPATQLQLESHAEATERRDCEARPEQATQPQHPGSAICKTNPGEAHEPYNGPHVLLVPERPTLPEAQKDAAVLEPSLGTATEATAALGDLGSVELAPSTEPGRAASSAIPSGEQRPAHQAATQLETDNVPAVAPAKVGQATSIEPAVESDPMTRLGKCAASASKSRDKRRAKRIQSRLPAMVIGEGTGPGLRCVICDRSSNGAKLQLAQDRYCTGHGDLSVGDRVTLAYQVAQEATSVLCEVMWVRDLTCGVNFIGQFRVESLRPTKTDRRANGETARKSSAAKSAKDRLAKAFFSH